MGNIGGPEILVIFIVALIVLGPNKLPGAARQFGKAMAELRRVSSGFQREMKDAMEDPLAEEKAREAGRKEVAKSQQQESHPLAGRPPIGAAVVPATDTEPTDTEPTKTEPTDPEPTDA